MPLVRRTRKDRVEHLHIVRETSYQIYVPPSNVRRTDTVVEPTARQLAELALTCPEEYGEAAAAAGVAPADPGFDVAAFLDMKAAGAVAVVQALEAEGAWDTLAAAREAEEERQPKPRATVLAALEVALGGGEE